MLAKLLAMLAHAKGASIAIVVTVSAATATVGAATPEVQDAVKAVAAAVGIDLTDTHGANALRGCDDQTGQPAVVAQRNAADKMLRAAYETDHKALLDLRGGKDLDNKLVGDVVRNYDDQLRGTLNKALVDVAALTLGREGQVRKAASASPAVAANGATSATNITTTCEATNTTTGSSPKPSKSPKPSASPEQGRVAVANRTTLNDGLQAIVDKTTEDMKTLVEKATDEVAKLPPLERGNTTNGNKPADKGGKP